MTSLSSGGIYTIYVTDTIRPDAETINRLGIIRGSIQRLVKLEAAGADSGGLMNTIDGEIDQFFNKKLNIYDEKDEIHLAIDDLSLSWDQLKSQIQKYRATGAEQDRDALLKSSEVIWDKANNMVFVSQMVAEKKVTGYRLSFGLFGLNLILGFLIIYLMKRYVRDRLEYLVNYDELTGIYNRRYFVESLKKEIERTCRYNRELSLILFDIDHFKAINDTYGHDVGDVVLRELSSLVGSNIRVSDIFCRLGGDEFAVVIPETGIDGAIALSEKIRSVIAGHGFKTVGDVRISLGITQFVSGDDTDKIYKRADQALYNAKNGGRNRNEAVIAGEEE